MKGRVWVVAFVFVILLGVFVSCSKKDVDDCPSETADPDGYLQAICEYIFANDIDVSPGNPTTYQIKEIQVSARDGRPVVIVFLNCCYMGDRAFIDLETGEVVDLQLGDQ